ncbi:CGNR zinc finger domain-containing protein [Geodermatophilus sp. DSM 44513]|uniref:CGNR zinc finger domain-containing protein n=1 Tax=Geodermatophilus sp. DSM 44513 TaxID=1528104 RepID=UPI001AA10D7E|nr:CGNR zinc finger domain-containing protein [Geodermatophilus sp. DSM 44513]WNV73872.1 CGNR zinc finger domain-containing protein [Geodermatophilus sp. DSM 44513]
MSDEELLTALANTGHEGADEMADPAALASWWAGLRGPVGGTASSETTRAALRDLRRAVREAAARHNGADGPRDGPEVPIGDARGPVAGLALRPDLSGGRVSLVPQGDGDLAADVAAVVLVALLRASAGPAWSRVKACRGADCGWVFVDASRNRSRRWCEMASCGNRAKTATFRARHRDERRPAAARPRRGDGTGRLGTGRQPAPRAT